MPSAMPFKNDVHELEWFVFEGTSTSGAASQASTVPHREMTASWKMISKCGANVA